MSRRIDQTLLGCWLNVSSLGTGSGFHEQEDGADTVGMLAQPSELQQAAGKRADLAKKVLWFIC
jgi:hypothetical protein